MKNEEMGKMKNEEWRMKNENYSSNEQGKTHSSFFILHFIILHSSFFILHSKSKGIALPSSRLESVMPSFSVKTPRKSLFSVVFS